MKDIFCLCVLYSTRVGVLTYGGQAYPKIWLDDERGWNKETLKDEIDKVIWEDQSTNTSGGIWRAREQMFTQARGARRNAPKLMVVMTDGASNVDETLTCRNAQDAK